MASSRAISMFTPLVNWLDVRSNYLSVIDFPEFQLIQVMSIPLWLQYFIVDICLVKQVTSFY